MVNKRIIRISKNVIFITPECSFTIEQTNLPNPFSFTFSRDIYFEVEPTSFEKEDKIAFIKITDYSPKDYSSFSTQTVKTKIDGLYFEKMDWKQLKAFLVAYNESALQKAGLIFNNESLEANQINLETPNIKVWDTHQNEEAKALREEFMVYFNDAYFELGFVSFTKKLKNYEQPINFKIENSHIRPEFNLIKNYFPKAFGNKKKFHVSANIQSKDDQILNVYATSPEIQQIDEVIIDSVKRARTLNLISVPKFSEIDKSLFTSEDIFSNFDDKGEEGNVFKQSESDIFNFLLEERTVRNKKQLQYLAGYKHSSKQKIRFTLKPNFGFLFFIEGETMYHYCWELLNSHATYLWSFDKIESDIHFQYKRIEENINTIREQGRQNYKNAYREDKIKTDVNFCILDHRKINSKLKDGFVEWRHKFNERIV